MTMPVPMPVETLTRHNDADVGVPGGVLAHGGGVGVVRRQHRDAGKRGLQVLGHRVGVPAREHRRLAGPARHRVDRGREAQSQPAQVVRGRGPACRGRRPSRRRSGRAPRRGRRSTGTSIESSTRTAPPRSVTAIRVCVVSIGDHEHVGLGGVEGQAAAPPTAGGLTGLALDDHSRREQRVEALADGHAGQPGGLEHVAARGGPSVADQVEDVAGSRRHRTCSFLPRALPEVRPPAELEHNEYTTNG